MRSVLLRLRRTLLKNLVPEFIWPKFVEIDGISFAVRGTPYSFGVKRLLTRDPDSYEKEERGFLNELTEDDHVIEFGSSIGILTALICERALKGKVIAVEVSQPLIEYSGTWLSRYRNLTLVNAAAFPVHDNLKLKLSFDDSSGSLGGVVDYGEFTSSSHTPTEELTSDNIKSFFIKDAEAVPGFKPTVLIADIEGSEDIVLREAMQLPDSIDRIFIELHSYIYGKETESKIIERISEQGFELRERRESVYFFKRRIG